MVYQHQDSGKSTLRVENGLYSVPEAVQEHLDLVEPTIRFPPRQHVREMNKLDVTPEQVRAGDVSSETLFGGYNTPPRLYTLYSMDETSFVSVLDAMSSSDVSLAQAIVSYDEEYYLDSDLQLA